MEVITSLLFLLLGVFTGILAGFFGIGGGMVIVPTMLFLGHSYASAVGISILQMALSSVVGSVANFKKGLLNMSVGLYAGFGGLIGAGFSGLILKYIPHKILLGLFILVTLYSLLRFVLGGSQKSQERQIQNLTSKDKFNLLWIGAFTGIFAISLGIGGGVLMVPLLSRYLNLSPKQSVPLSLFFVVFSSISGVISLTHQGLLQLQNMRWGLLVGVGSVLGVMLGVRLVSLVPTIWHRGLLIFVYILSILVSIYKWL
ncbi:sulfite exporter TauE/SafE family protein [Helicobacter suis]|uniref:sulfite exporter TauE/SafE family protein n=1 Tax=Helicobacter suis TaxID=104628 RepID=UPI0013D834BE|nr:sulfite exporter TauE/SafE family protein [Helicobacter suis]